MTFSQVLTGELPFRNYRPQELAYYVSYGSRPEKPADAKEIGISDPLWDLIRNCWDGKIADRPQIQEVVKGVGDAAANWHTDMPPSGTDQPEDSPVDEVSGEFNHSGFPLSRNVVQVVIVNLRSGNIPILSQRRPTTSL